MNIQLFNMKKKIVFTNNSEIDPRSISTFGVSVKDTENPIGFFGTGLKYSIAVLLRNNQKIEIYSGESHIVFAIDKQIIRGKEFEFITMQIDSESPQSIGFTTELGKNWEMWMAYREIACNCMDEGGQIEIEKLKVDGEQGKTKIIVTGELFEEAYLNRRKYLLEDDANEICGGMEIRNYPSSSFFYRGVNVFLTSKPCLYTYNSIGKLDLTEDRTLTSEYAYRYRLVSAILSSRNKKFIQDIVTAKNDFYEASLDFSNNGEPSEEFLSVVGICQNQSLTNLNETALKVWIGCTKKSVTPKEITLTEVQKKSLKKALIFCSSIGFDIEGSYPIKFAESLGNGCLGLAYEDTIYIAERVFHLGGTKQLTSTLIEEYLHLRHGWKDMTRELQSFLFDKIVSLGEEIQGEPL